MFPSGRIAPPFSVPGTLRGPLWKSSSARLEAKQVPAEMVQTMHRAVTPVRRDVDKLREDVDTLMEGKTT